MKKVEQPVLVLINCDTQLVNLTSQVINLRTPRKMSEVLKMLQGSTDFCAMPLYLRSNIIKRGLSPHICAIELKLKYHQPKYTAHTLYLQDPLRIVRITYGSAAAAIGTPYRPRSAEAASYGPLSPHFSRAV